MWESLEGVDTIIRKCLFSVQDMGLANLDDKETCQSSTGGNWFDNTIITLKNFGNSTSSDSSGSGYSSGSGDSDIHKWVIIVLFVVESCKIGTNEFSMSFNLH